MGASLRGLLVLVTRCGDGVALACFVVSRSEDVHVLAFVSVPRMVIVVNAVVCDLLGVEWLLV